MITKNILKSIQDDVRVDDDLAENDPRYIFILDEYNELCEDGVPLPPITDEMTFGEIKENLDNCPSSKKALLLLYKFQDEFLTTSEAKKSNDNTLFKIIAVTTFCLTVAIVLISLLVGIVTGSLDPTQLIMSFFQTIGQWVAPLFSSPEHLGL